MTRLSDRSDSYRYTAVLTLPEQWAPHWSRATFGDLQLIGPSGDTTYIATTGVVTGSIEPRGRLIIELFSDGNHGNRFTLTLIGDAGFGAHRPTRIKAPATMATIPMIVPSPEKLRLMSGSSPLTISQTPSRSIPRFFVSLKVEPPF